MGFGGLDLTGSGRPGGHQGGEQGRDSLSYFVDGSIERFLVRGRWCGKPADLPYELQGCRPDFLVGRPRFEIIQGLDIPTHFAHLPSSDSERPPSRCHLFFFVLPTGGDSIGRSPIPIGDSSFRDEFCQFR